MGANASTAVPVYVSGQVLDAARLNLTNAGIPVFSGTATRDAAFGGSGEKTLAEGQFVYLEDTDALQYYSGSSFVAVGGGTRIGQVVSTTKTDTFTTSSTSFVDVTGLTVSITPTLASSTIYIVFNSVIGAVDGAAALFARFMRGSTAIGIGDAAGSRIRGTTSMVGDTNETYSMGASFVDSPATTSATTYKIQIMSNTGGTVAINRGITDTDNAYRLRGIATLTVMEILA